VGPRNRVLGRAPSPGEEAILAGFQPTELIIARSATIAECFHLLSKSVALSNIQV